MKNRSEKFYYDQYYHVYNRAVGTDCLFREDRNYQFFLKGFSRFLNPWVELYAYCLIPNHFHFLIRVKSESELENLQIANERLHNYVTKAFGNFFNSYTRSYNKVYDRKGKLFIQSYSRIRAKDDIHLRTMMKYIHRNPVHHGLAHSYYGWQYSSYREFLSAKGGMIDIKVGIQLFGSREIFIRDHEEYLTDLSALKEPTGLYLKTPGSIFRSS